MLSQVKLYNSSIKKSLLKFTHVKNQNHIQFFLLIVFLLFTFHVNLSYAQILPDDQEYLRQQQRANQLREQLEPSPTIQLHPVQTESVRIPESESPCSIIQRVALVGELSEKFQWALNAASIDDDLSVGRCIGTQGMSVIMRRIQNVILQRGFTTTRVLLAPQNLQSGVLTFTLIPGRINQILFVESTSSRATLWNAVPAKPGDLLNLRDLEQALENFKRVPTAEADIQITPSSSVNAKPGDSDVLIRWSQRLPFRVNLSLDDSGSEYTGKYITATTLSYDHAFALNDLFYSSVIQDVGGGLPGNRGTSGYTLHYSIPLQQWLISTTTTSNNYHQSVQGLNQVYIYKGNSATSDLRLTRILYRDARRKLSAGFRLWSRESHNFTDDTEVEVQRRRTNGWEMSVSHQEFLNLGALNFNLAYRRGTGVLNTLRAPEELFGEGSSRMQIINADASLNYPFSLRRTAFRYTAAWRAQWNLTPLSPEDRFAIGNRYTVRGFDGERLLTAERGWTVRQEIAGLIGQTGCEAYAGIDAGQLGGKSSLNLPGTYLAGAVLGIRLRSSGAYLDFFVGKPISRPAAYSSNDLNTGFNLSYSF